ncbi:hypothetical protein CCH79_00016519 [Gambusia affinis]|uniref:PARP catalytic domain-containing protein n=1 Tax=Gambusia affinis TaxID=33528 RepID=A0A315V1G2_GAMAF|nr:hypothetical protein CCH79_00016519 [Gambusia affinis]
MEKENQQMFKLHRNVLIRSRMRFWRQTETDTTSALSSLQLPISSSRDSDSIMNRVQWAEDDFDLPAGVIRLVTPQPTDDKTYVMFHGTTRALAQIICQSGFQPSKDGMLGPGVYLSRDLQKASRYPIGHDEWDKAVIKVKVNVGKVKRIDRQKHPLQKTWHYHGYDTAWVPPNCGMVPSGLEENCVWDPRRITILRVINPTVVPAQHPHGYMIPVQQEFMVRCDPTGKGFLNRFKPNLIDAEQQQLMNQNRATLKRNLARVSRSSVDLHHVEPDIGLPVEGLATHLAAMAFLPGVRVAVLRQEAAVAEAAAAHLAPGVPQHVLPEVEGLPAVAAAERLLPCVDPQVHLQVALRVVALPTDVTHPLAEMGLQVELQVLLGVELVPADTAELRVVGLSVIH